MAKNYKSKLQKAIEHPEWLLGVFIRHTPVGRWMNDRTFIRWEYFSGMGKFPDLETPRTYNEKLQWLKLNDVHPGYSSLADKSQVKDIVSGLIGREYIIPTLGVWDSFDDIDFSALPERFVLKTTHDSGGVAVVKDKNTADLGEIRKKLDKSLKHNYFNEHREYPYKNIRPRIIAEEYISSKDGKPLDDYKFFCFDGEPRMLFVATGRPVDTRFDFYDADFNHLPVCQGHPAAAVPPGKPAGFDRMLEISRKLSQGIPHVRVDLYNIDGKIYFGEMTFFHFSGNVPFEPEEWDYKIGEWLTLPSSEK